MRWTSMLLTLALPVPGGAQDAPPEPPALDEPAAAVAPPGRSYIQITGASDAPLPLALPPCRLEGLDPERVDAAWAVAKRDLDLTGWFSLLDPAAFLEPESAGVAPGTFDFEDWRLPGAVALAKSACRGGEVPAVELHVYDVDAGQPLASVELAAADADPRLLGHRLADAIVFAITGQRSVFQTRIVTVANFGQGKEIFVLDWDGTQPRPISRNGSINLSPAWSPDGGRISYTSYRDNNPDLWITDLATMRHHKVSSWPGINAGAEWSPLGGEIALTLSKDGDSDVYVISPEGSILRRLTRQWGIDVSPAWSPDGARVAFVSQRNGNPQIFVMDRDGGEPRQLTRLGGHNVSPAWSPDGTQIAFAGRDKGRFDLFVVNVDGSGLRRLTQVDADDEDPTWSPDGNHILFSSSRSGSRQLWLIRADGRHPVQLTDGRGSYTNPQWGPAPR